MEIEDFLQKKKLVSVIGLGYVGLPLALVLAKKFRVVGFDINAARVAQMQQSIDPSQELSSVAFEGADITFTHRAEDLQQAHFHIVAVPTPIDEHNNPDLTPLLKASKTVGQQLKKGDYVVFESTVYPGCTEEDCVPILEHESGLKFGLDFKVGYSPERINPGDKEHTVEKILKVVSGSDAEASALVAQIYGAVIQAGVYQASSIKVAEAAKVIENTQRDLNIAFMNELSVIFDRMGIDTQEVLEAAGTKWNFLKFFPGLVGGHCIGVDPYYLLHKSKEMGYTPHVITSGRKINDEMPAYIAKRLVQMLIQHGKNPGQCRVLVLGITFKENVADIRNSKVADLVHELQQYSIAVHLVDPYASAAEVAHEYNLTLYDAPEDNYDAVIVAVAHKQFAEMNLESLRALMNGKPLLLDLKGIYTRAEATEREITYWRL
jgi:UDP-N-acetyl-D-galactosamine dehydrogenase